MSWLDAFKRSATGVFATATLTGHLVRGAVAFALLACAMQMRTEQPILALLAGVGALVAFRGCPMCLTVGLFETLAQKLRASTTRT